MSTLAKDETGAAYGRLTVLRRVENDRHGNARWLCRCSCGREKPITASALRKGAVVSCGCFHREKTAGIRRRHGACQGHETTREYDAYKSMLARCERPRHPSYHHYGGRGIRVCERWRAGFEYFLADMGRRPSDAHSLERLDNNAGYSAANCKWATKAEQCRNKRTNNLVTFNGRTLCVTDWAREAGISQDAMRERIKSWPLELALTAPKGFRP